MSQTEKREKKRNRERITAAMRCTASFCQRLCGCVVQAARALWHRWLCRIVKRVVLPTSAMLALVGLLLGIGVFAVNGAVCRKTEERILSVEALASMEGELDCILVLGCRVYPDGEPSAMLYDRIQTAADLYLAGVGERVLMSGDNQDVYYNEVASMQREAVALGVPEEAILCDPYGLSTYDSVVRALKEYGCERVVIVTQSYHLYRALYIAEKMGIEAYGVSADRRPYYGQTKRDLREILARCKDVVYAHKQMPTTRELQLEALA